MINVRLRRLNVTDAEAFEPWFADEEAIRYSLSLFRGLRTMSDIEVWLWKTLQSPSNYVQGIVREDDGRLIGYAGISGISAVNRAGEFFIFIGDRLSWNQGYGKEVTREFLRIGFEELNLNRVWLTVSEPNEHAVRAYKGVGYVEEGRLRQACFRDGSYHDKLVMSVLRQEWEQRHQEPTE